ncbi:superoxide dismutase [Globomyces pollinis-pini]|nr:superoxide dismutase [Globomyces pollinis-pini]
MGIEAKAIILPDKMNSIGNVSGFIKLYQTSIDVQIQFKIKGLLPNSIHAIHIHSLPVKDQDCLSTAGHYNPMEVDHGAPDDTIRHHGDLGNFKADENGFIETIVTDKIIRIDGTYGVVNRGFVIHELEDDLGKGTHPTSKLTGNAGSRLACGTIEIVPNSFGLDLGWQEMGVIPVMVILAFIVFLCRSKLRDIKVD